VQYQIVMALCARATAAAATTEGRAAGRCTQQTARKAHDVAVNGRDGPAGFAIARLLGLAAAQHACRQSYCILEASDVHYVCTRTAQHMHNQHSQQSK